MSITCCFELSNFGQSATVPVCTAEARAKEVLHAAWQALASFRTRHDLILLLLSLCAPVLGDLALGRSNDFVCAEAELFQQLLQRR